MVRGECHFSLKSAIGLPCLSISRPTRCWPRAGTECRFAYSISYRCIYPLWMFKYYFHDGMFIIIKGVMAYWYMFSSWCECLGLVSRKMSVESISSENLLKPDMSWVESSLILHLTHCSSFWKQQKSRAHGSCKLWTTCSNPTASVVGCFGLQPSTVSFERCCRSWKRRNATVWSRR